MAMRETILGLLFLISTSTANAAVPLPTDPFSAAYPRTRVMVLGMFHFADAGLDGYKPEHHFDPLSDDGKRSVSGLLDRLKCFAPTHIALEYRREKQTKLDERYARFLRGELDDSRNEIDRVGLALAAQLGQTQVYAVDAPALDLYPDIDNKMLDGMIDAWGQRGWAESPWGERFFALYARDDATKLEVPLLETLGYINSAERLRIGHGHNLIGPIRVGSGEPYAYIGADAALQWYSRNLRIFANLARLTRDPGDRVLLVIGAGHVPLIKHALESSPEYDYVSPEGFLAGTAACSGDASQAVAPGD